MKLKVAVIAGRDIEPDVLDEIVGKLKEKYMA